MLAIIVILTALTVALFALTCCRCGRDRELWSAVWISCNPRGAAGCHGPEAAPGQVRATDECSASARTTGGERPEGHHAVRLFLIQAGFSDPRAVSMYWASRVEPGNRTSSTGAIRAALARECLQTRCSWQSCTSGRWGGLVLRSM